MPVFNPRISVIGKGSRPGMVTLRAPQPCHVINEGHVAMFLYEDSPVEQTAEYIWNMFKSFKLKPAILEEFRVELENMAGLNHHQLR